MRTILTFTNNSVRYALFPPAERLIIDICRESGKMNDGVTRPFNEWLMRVVPRILFAQNVEEW